MVFALAFRTLQALLSVLRALLEFSSRSNIRQFASTVFLPLESPSSRSIWTGCLMDLMDAQRSPRITLSPPHWLESPIPRIPRGHLP